jgi:F0F1-type ATP synthase epsilon subunit
MAGHTDASTGQVVAEQQESDPKADKDGKPLMRVKVYSPFKTFFDEMTYSISAENDTGPFDVLPHHHNFMTLLNPCVLIIQTQHGEQKIRIARGLMHVKAERVTVFLDV